MTKKYIASVIAFTLFTLAGVAGAQTSDPAATPGVGNTGSGGNAPANMILLGTSALVAIGGTVYLVRKHT